MKRCSRCGEIKPVEAFAPKRKAEPHKRHSLCRACSAIEGQRWAENNRLKIKEYRARYREKARATTARWRAANPEKVKAYRRREYERNADAYRSGAAEWRRLNPERAKAAVKRWVDDNPEAYREMNRRGLRKRRARLAQVFVEDINELVVLERDDGACGICGEDVDPFNFEIDHVWPIALGGRHAYDNVQVAHASCNRKKGATA